MPRQTLIARVGRVGDFLFVMKGFPGFEFAEGDASVVAHDLVDHIDEPCTKCTYEGEMRALGVAWYCRGAYEGTFSRDSSGPSSVSEIAAMELFDLLSAELAGPEKPRDYAHIGKVRLIGEYVSDLLDIREELIRVLGIEAEHDNGPVNHDWDEIATMAVKRMLLGIRRAKRRYGRPNVGNNLFYAIKESVEEAKEFLSYDGQELVVEYNITECTAKTTVLEMDFGDLDD